MALCCILKPWLALPVSHSRAGYYDNHTNVSGNKLSNMTSEIYVQELFDILTNMTIELYN